MSTTIAKVLRIGYIPNDKVHTHVLPVGQNSERSERTISFSK